MIEAVGRDGTNPPPAPRRAVKIPRVRTGLLTALLVATLSATAAAQPVGAPTPAADVAPPPNFGEHGPVSLNLDDLLEDGVVLYLAGLAFVLLVIRRQLREEPRWVPWGLAGVVTGGAAVRLAMAPVAPLNAWSYVRVIPLAERSYEGVVLPLASRALGLTVHLTAVIFSAGFALAAAAPLVLFAHARYVLKDGRSALAAAAILALLPLHIRFSHCDVEILQSLLTSSFTFVVLYCALTDASPSWRAACFLALPLLCLATYYARPEAIVFFPLDLGGVLVASSASPRGRRALASALISAAAVFSVVNHLLTHYRHNVDDGLSVRTLHTAATTLFSLRHDMILNPWSSPPGLVLLAALGAATLWRAGERGRMAFLALWFLAFFVVHSYVVPTVPAMTARYHLNLVTPFVLLAAAATPALLRAPVWVRVAAALYVVASPLVHRAFIRDVDYFEMREFAFLTAVRDRIPDRCTVLEFQPAVSTDNPSLLHGSRLARVGSILDRGAARWSWEVVPLGVLPPLRPGEEPREVLSPAARAILRTPRPCTMLYLGLTCASHRPLSAPEAPVCAEARATLDLVPVAETRFRSRVYDSVAVGRLVSIDGATHTVHALHDGSEVRLGLYRVRIRGARTGAP